MPTQLQPSKRLHAADGIRGLACLIVLVIHSISLFWPASFPYLKGSGKYAVWLFFVLSAFLLTQGLQRRGFSKPNLIDYTISRTLRILPMFILACFIYYLAGIGIDSHTQLFEVLSLEQGTIHLWTIPAEFKFYLLLPPLVWAAITLQQRFGNTGLLLSAAGFLALQQTLWPYWLTPESTIDTRWYLPCFLFGIIAALLLPTLRKLPREHLATPYALACLALLIVLLPGAQLWLFGTQPNDYLVNKHLYFGLMWVAFIALLVDGHGLAGRLLCSRPMSFLGAISYSAYLFHLLIMLPLTEQWPEQPATYIAAVGLSIAAGAAGYYLAERPLEHLRRQISARAQ